MMRINAYLISVEGKDVAVAEKDLAEAKSVAAAYLDSQRRTLVRIELSAAPAPTQAWYYDYEISQWVMAAK